MLTATSTIPALALAYITEKAAALEADRQARLAGAKTNLARLMAAGIVITVDDAFDNAMRWEAETARMARESITRAEARRRFTIDGAIWRIVGDLRHAVAERETDQERTERAQAILAEVKGTKDNGRRCLHVSTQKERGWMDFGWNADGSQGFCCGRCNARAVVPVREEPTEQALAAAAILAAAGLPLVPPGFSLKDSRIEEYTALEVAAYDLQAKA